MKLIVVGHGFKDTIYGITLEEGRIPGVSSLSEEETQNFHIPEIEPAVWFKTLVLTTVTVHCVKRQITWSSSADSQNNNKHDRFQNSMISTCTLDSISEDISAQGDEKLDQKHSEKLLRKKKRGKFENAKRMSESMFLHTHGRGQNADLDELFNQTSDVLDDYDTKKITKLEYYQELFRLLHCYILPSITFNKDDVPELEAALEFQTALILRQDDKISNKFAESENVGQSLARQREHYCKEIEGLKNASKLDYPHPLAIALLNDFQEDLQSLSTKLAEAQTDVNLIKSQLKTIEVELGNVVSTYLESNPTVDPSTTVDNFPQFQKLNISEEAEVHAKTESKRKELETELACKRKIRDNVFESYKQILHIREIVSEYVSDRVLLKSDSKSRITKRQIIRSKLKLKGKKTVENPLHKIYMNLAEIKNEKIIEVQKLIEEKVRLVSVKEGVKSALDELQTETTSYGVDFDNFGSLRSTDVMSRPGLPTNWQTIEEQVKQIIDDNKHPVSKKHISGCERILTECRLLKKFHSRYLESETDSGTHRGSPDTASLTDSMSYNCFTRRSRTSSLSTSYESSQRRSDVNPDYILKRNNSYSQVSRKDFEESGESEGGGTFLVHVPFGGVCVPLQNVACVEGNGSFYANSDRLSCSSLVQFEEINESQSSSDDLVIIHDVSPDYARKAVDKIQGTIREHMDKMCKKLQKTLDKEGTLNYQKIWSCYERIFFTLVYPTLEQIYKLAYLDILQGLKDSVPRLTPQALAMMDNSIVYKLFCDKTEIYTTQSNANSDLSVDEECVFHDDDLHLQNTGTHTPIPQENNSALNIKSKMRTNRFASEPTLGDETNKEREQKGKKQSKNSKKMNRETAIYTDGIETTLSTFGVLDVDQPYEEVSESFKQSSGLALSEMDSALHLETFDIIPDPLKEDVSRPSMHSLPVITIDDETSEQPSDTYSQSSCNLNMDLAESIIANSATGQLNNQMTKNSPISGSNESILSNTQMGRSKYANVLDKINMDYARQLQKNVHIYYPVSVNYCNITDRNTWPLVNKGLIEYGEDALISSTPTREDLDQLEESTSFNDAAACGTIKRSVSVTDFNKKTIKIKPEYKEKLQSVILILQEMCKETTPTDKLKKGFVSLRELGNQVFNIANQLYGRAVGASADELSDFLVVLLCNIDMKLLVKLYISVQMMRDLIPEFLETGPYGFTVMQLTIGLHFLQERIVMQRGLIQNDRARAYHEM